MNIIGKLGNLIVDYQSEIEMGVFALLCLIFVIWIIKLIVTASKKKTMLSEINEKVTDIDSKISLIQKKQEEIDSLHGFIHKEPPCASEKKEPLQPCAERDADSDSAFDDVAPLNEFGADDMYREDYFAESMQPIPGFHANSPDVYLNEFVEESYPDQHIPMNEDDNIHKFYSRDCATDKYGNTYTEDVLNRQIG